MKRRLGRILYERGQLDTAPPVQQDDVSVSACDRRPYSPTGWLFLRRALQGLRIHHDDVFVDFGSGMGRVVCYVARRYPARRVVGVEIAGNLAAIAAENLTRIRGRLRSKHVELVTGDVLDYEIPDDVTYAYFYNPFVGDVFREVIDNIIRSLDRRPRPLTLIYAHPKMEADLLATGRFDRVRTSCGRWRRPARTDRWISIYRSRLPGHSS